MYRYKPSEVRKIGNSAIVGPLQTTSSVLASSGQPGSVRRAGFSMWRVRINCTRSITIKLLRVLDQSQEAVGADVIPRRT